MHNSACLSVPGCALRGRPARAGRRSLFGWLVAGLVLTGAFACGPAASPSTPSQDGSGQPQSTVAKAASAAADSVPSTPAAAARSARAPGSPTRLAAATVPVLATDSVARGLEPLGDSERAELASGCKPLADAIVAAAKRDGRKKPAAQYVDQVLASPPKLKGVDLRRCAGLMRRDLAVYLARTMEAEAIMNLKRLVVGLSTAAEEQKGRLCPSASPVPQDLDVLRRGPYRSTAAQWRAEGWACARFDLSAEPQRFQYALETDPQSQSFVLRARGFVVDAEPPEELYLSGKMEGGTIEPSSNVVRR
jgi:hypothetical protein